MKLWQHKRNPDIKYLVKPTEDGEGVHILVPRLSPGGEYLVRSHWASGGIFPHGTFMENFEPVKLHETDKKTREFYAREMYPLIHQ